MDGVRFLLNVGKYFRLLKHIPLGGAMRFLMTLIMATVFAASAQADIKTDKQGIDTACAQEAALANCGSEQVGSGLLKCLHAHKIANKSVQFSDACKAALTNFRADKKAIKSNQGTTTNQTTTNP
ncbi:MAG: hypothetical protein PHR16_13415 [Methylovulum sp.]|nr:hypothetical protein [Methylovulum sp.]